MEGPWTRLSAGAGVIGAIAAVVALLPLLGNGTDGPEVPSTSGAAPVPATPDVAPLQRPSPSSSAALKPSTPAMTSVGTTLAASPNRGGPSVVVTFAGVGFAPGEAVAFQITASSDAVPPDRGGALVGRCEFSWRDAAPEPVSGSELAQLTYVMPIPDDCLLGRNGLADVATADRRGAIEVFYFVPSGQAFRDLHLAYGDGLLPVTHTMIAVGNTTNRKATATYVQDQPMS